MRFKYKISHALSLTHSCVVIEFLEEHALQVFEAGEVVSLIEDLRHFPCSVVAEFSAALGHHIDKRPTCVTGFLVTLLLLLSLFLSLFLCFGCFFPCILVGACGFNEAV